MHLIYQSGRKLNGAWPECPDAALSQAEAMPFQTYPLKTARYEIFSEYRQAPIAPVVSVP